MTIRVGDYISITSTNNTFTNYGFITRINDDTIEVKLKIMLMLSHYIPSLDPFARDLLENFFLQSNKHQLYSKNPTINWLGMG